MCIFYVVTYNGFSLLSIYFQNKWPLSTYHIELKKNWNQTSIRLKIYHILYRLFEGVNKIILCHRVAILFILSVTIILYRYSKFNKKKCHLFARILHIYVCLSFACMTSPIMWINNLEEWSYLMIKGF